MRHGLILEGGALRGLFTAGVLDVFMEAGLAFDGAIGVSAGACFGCNLKSRQPGRVIRYNRRFARDPRYCSWASLVKTGDLFGADFCYRELPLELDPFDCATYDANPMEFHLSATDCETGRPVYRRLDRADEATFRWMRASASMPLVSRPVEIDGRYYLDGGLSDGIPLAYFESLGYERNVVITTRPHGYRKFPSWKFALLKPCLRRFPAIYRALKTRHEWYNAALRHVDAQVAAGKAFLICPDAALPVSRVCHDPETMQQVYDLGRATAERLLPRVRDFLASRPHTGPQPNINCGPEDSPQPKIEICGVRAKVARTFAERARGLIGTRELPEGEGLLIERCNAIHTFFMRFPIDAIFLDKHNRIVKTVRNIRPWRWFVWGGWRARKVLEFQSRG